MRILQVVPYFKPSQLGGPAISVYNLSKELAKRNYVDVYTSNALTISENFNSERTKIDGINVLYLNRYLKSKLYISPSLVKVVRESIKNFDVIHLNDFRTFHNIVISHYAKKFKVPYILSARGTLKRVSQKFFGKKVFDFFYGKKILSNSSAFMAISEDESNEYNELNLKKKIFTIPNGIDTKIFSRKQEKGSFKKEYGIGDRKMVLFLGRVSKRKGVHHVIRAIKNIDCRFVIGGVDDGYLKEVKRIISENHLEEKVIFTGFMDLDLKLSALNDADVFVYPSEYEAFGISIIEALAFDKPVIIGDDCGIKDFVLKNGFGSIIRFGDVKGIEDSIKKCLNMRIKSRKKVFDSYSWRNIAKDVEKMYKEVIDFE